MLKTTTIRKFCEKARGMLATAITVLCSLHVCLSPGNKKVGKTLNVSLLPIITCGKACKVCMGICYDIKACIFRPTVMWARARNTALALYDRDRYFAEIADKMRRRQKHFYFRWHVGGDIPDYDYFCRMVENARQFSHFRIWGYTKQYDIVNRFIREHGGSIQTAFPSNFIMMFSVWDGLECINPYGLPTFECVLDGHEWPENVHHCNGDCQWCNENGHGCPYGENSAVAQH